MAEFPSWQVAHAPGATPVWFIVAGVHAVVEWHVSQAWVVWMCLVAFPFALVPSWQVEQPPGTTSVWLNFAGVQPVVV
ncbi:MAG: hypothetical protein U1E86_08275 [Burkholderiaceae bacterium]